MPNTIIFNDYGTRDDFAFLFFEVCKRVPIVLVGNSYFSGTFKEEINVAANFYPENMIEIINRLAYKYKMRNLRWTTKPSFNSKLSSFGVYKLYLHNKRDFSIVFHLTDIKISAIQNAQEFLDENFRKHLAYKLSHIKLLDVVSFTVHTHNSYDQIEEYINEISL